MDDVATRDDMGIARGTSGGHTGDGTKLTVTLGYRPQHVKIVNVTDAAVWEKIDGMTDAQTIKVVTAGTTTVDTGSTLVITDDGFTLAAAANVNAKVFVWFAQ